MLGSAISFVVSLSLILLTRVFMMSNLIYQNKKEVSQILTQINQYVYNNFGIHNSYATQNSIYNSLLVRQDNDYCRKSDLYKYYHPDVLMKDTYFIREVRGLIKEILQDHYFDGIPQMQFFRKNTEIPPKYSFPLQLTLPFNYYDQVLTRFKETNQSMCLFWKNNHMQQRHSLSHKDNLQNNYYNYLQKLRQNNLDPECLLNATYIPRSYRLFQKDECIDFFNHLNSAAYKEKEKADGPQFITKLGLEVHRGRGIVVLFPHEVENIKNDYGNGKKCGQVKELKVVQQYINNPYLYKGHKIEFRIYFVFASTLPIIAYAHDKALIRRCAKPFDKFSIEKAAHVCNTAILKQTLAKEGKNPEIQDDNDEIEGDEFFIDWKLDQLQRMLLEQGKIKDPQWLQNYLYPIVDRSIIHAIRSAEHTFSKDSKLAEFFAADFLLTDDFQVYIMEINYNPQTLKSTPLRIINHTKMVKDMIDIQNAYIRSKYLRIKKLIKKLIPRITRQGKKLSEIMDEDLHKEIQKIYHDKLDQGIQLSEDNQFRLELKLTKI
ncbi:hypothetical protein pb186bvf_020167 [Paramecium bursaria]